LVSDLILTHFWMGILVFLSTNLNEEGMDPKLQFCESVYILWASCVLEWSFHGGNLLRN
jgi:hypothetical protein